MRSGLRALALGAVVLAPLSSGCRTLDRFDTGESEAYCGNIVQSVVREGFTPALRLRIRLDTDHLASAPGTLTTNDDVDNPDTPDDERGDCAPQKLFDETPMLVTEEVLHDPISTFDFGTGRDHNFFAWSQSSCKGPIFTVVSLMKNDDVEVRLMRAPFPKLADAGAADAGAAVETDRGGFAVFQLTRQNRECLNPSKPK